MKNYTRKNRAYGRGATRKAKTAAKAVRRLKPSTKKAITTIAKRVYSRNTENKLIGWVVEKNVSHNSAISGADCEPLIQQITELDSTVAPSATQRVGDRVTPKSLMVKGMVSLKPSTSSSCQPVFVRVVIAAQKSIKVGSQVIAGAVDTNRLLRPGFSTGLGSDQIPFSGNTAELQFPINKDLFRVYYDRIIRLGSGVASGSGPDAPYPDYGKMWSYRFKQLPTSLTWDAGNGDWNNNFAPFVAIGYAYSDGTVPDTVTTKIVSNTTSHLMFEDA